MCHCPLCVCVLDAGRQLMPESLLNHVFQHVHNHTSENKENCVEG